MPEDDTQLQELFSKLAGRPELEICRQAKDPHLVPFMANLASSGDNPTAALRAFDAQVAQWRKMVNLMAKLKRDGKHYALEQLVKGLRSGAMPGEPEHLAKTEPYTIVMFEPEKVIALLEWFDLCDMFSIWNYVRSEFLGKKWDSEKRRRRVLTRAIQKLEHHFPGILRGLYKQSSEVLNLFSVPTSIVYEDTQRIVHERFRIEVEEPGNEYSFIASTPFHLPLGLGARINPPKPLAHLVRGNAHTVRKQIPTRSDQGRFATWTVHIPTYVPRDTQVVIGLHHEYEHGIHQNRYPSLASKGCQRGVGAFLCVGNDATYHHSTLVQTPEGQSHRFCVGITAVKPLSALN